MEEDRLKNIEKLKKMTLKEIGRDFKDPSWKGMWITLKEIDKELEEIMADYDKDQIFKMGETILLKKVAR